MRARPKPQLVIAPPSIDARLIDEYAEVRERMKAWKPDVNPDAERFRALQDLILKFYEREPAAQGYVAEGNRYRLPVTPRRMERSVTHLAKFFRQVGRDAYLLMCPPTLRAVEEAVEKDKRALFITEARTGVRTLGEPLRREAAEARIAA